MALPVLKKCCGCVSLETGSIILCIMSLLACLASIGVASWLLPTHRERRNEDNLVLMSMVMFTTLSAISNLAALAGVLRGALPLTTPIGIVRKPNYLQLSQVSNAVFLLCIFLVAVVTCLFSPALRPYLQEPGYVVLVVVLLVSAASYSFYYLTVVNSLHMKMKTTHVDSALPL